MRYAVWLSVACWLVACQRDSLQDVLPRGGETIVGATQLELLSLSPEPKPAPGTRLFHGWRVLGTTPIQAASTRSEILKAIAQGIREPPQEAAACFRPRHGLRATHAGETVDLLICFECFRTDVYVGEGRENSVRTARSPQPVLDAALRAAGVELAVSP